MIVQNGGQEEGSELHAEIPQRVVIPDIENKLSVHRRLVSVWDILGSERETRGANAERVIHELVFEDIGSGAHIWALIVITVLEGVVAYPIVCLAWLTKPCFVKEESHESLLNAVRLCEMRGRAARRFLGEMTTPGRPGESLLQFLVGIN